MSDTGLTVISPVPPTLALKFAGGRPFMRRVLIHRTRRSEAMALLAGAEPLALVMLDRQRARRAELAIAFAPAAAAHMRALIRFAQLTLARFAQAGVLVFTRIEPRWRQGGRMARLTGFVPG